MSEPFDLPFESDVEPTVLGDNSRFNFRCYKGISCFNACCKRADITLTPYDIIRLKTSLGVTSGEFLKSNTVPFEMDGDGMPGIKMRTTDEGQCLFMTEEGCRVYENRPTSCRYYPVAHLSMKAKEAKEETVHYALVQEDHCKGHLENREITVSDYRQEQEVEIFDDMNREYMQLILKKKSAGPSIGKLTNMSLQLFFMVNFDVDRFRRFILSETFKRAWVLDDAFYSEVEADDIVLMKFGSRLLRQVLFGEKTIEENDGFYDKRAEERKDVIDMRYKIELERARHKDEEKWKEDNT